MSTPSDAEEDVPHSNGHPFRDHTPGRLTYPKPPLAARWSDRRACLRSLVAIHRRRRSVGSCVAYRATSFQIPPKNPSDFFELFVRGMAGQLHKPDCPGACCVLVALGIKPPGDVSIQHEGRPLVVMRHDDGGPTAASVPIISGKASISNMNTGSFLSFGVYHSLGEHGNRGASQRHVALLPDPRHHPPTKHPPTRHKAPRTPVLLFFDPRYQNPPTQPSATP